MPSPIRVSLSARVRLCRNILLLLLLAGACLGGIDAWVGAPREPVYEGKRLSAWVHEASFNDNLSTLCDYLLAETDSAGVKWLAWAVVHGQTAETDDQSADPPPRVMQIARDLWRKVSGRRFEEDYDERGTALFVLGALGPEAAPAIPALVRLLSDPNDEVVERVASVLAVIGPAAWPALGDAFRDGDSHIRSFLLDTLDSSLVRTDFAPTVAQTAALESFLLEAMRDAEVRLSAAAALRTAYDRFAVHPPYDSALAVLIPMLSDPDPSLRIRAEQMIGYFGPNAADAIPPLIQLLADPDPMERGTAAFALGLIDREEKRSEPQLRSLLRDRDPTVSQKARSALIVLDLYPAR